MKKILILSAALTVVEKLAKELDDHEHHSATGIMGVIRGKALSGLEALEQHREWAKANPEPEKQPAAEPDPEKVPVVDQENLQRALEAWIERASADAIAAHDRGEAGT